jgi:hypothetical protein
VTDYGSGVCIARDEKGLYVLANQHVVGDRTMVQVHLLTGDPLRWRAFDARVLKGSHPTKYDLALLLVERPEPGENFTLKLAPDLNPNDRREGIDLMVVTDADRPFVWSSPLIERSVLWAGSPDEDGATTYAVSMACLFGGAISANSGSPAFEGQSLLGLHEVSPFEAYVTDPVKGGPPERVLGLGISTPARIRAFLSLVGYDHLIER